MDVKLFLSTFLTILIAEMGDKTQIAAMAASAQSKGAWEVAAGVCIALVVAGLLGFFAGKILQSWINPSVLKVLAGSLFIVMGLIILLRPS